MTNASPPPGVEFEPFPSADVEGSVPRRFEAQVRRRPERLAVAAGTQRLSYAALNSLANRIAWAILAASGQREEPVAVLLEKDARLIATLLAILKTGKIYVPLDPSYPQARNQAMLDDCGASLVVTEARHLPLAVPLASRGRRLLDLDTLDNALPTANPDVAVGPGSLASIFYTSGSTGQPKGVVQNHRNTLHNIMNFTNSLRLTADDRQSLLPSGGTMGGVRDILVALLNGAAVFPFSLQTDSFAALAEWLNRERITHFCTVVTVFRHFISTLSDDRFPTVRLVKCGSEALAASDLVAFSHHFPPTARMYSGFGTTETNNVTQILLEGNAQLPDARVPAGYPLPGMDFLILDDTGAPATPGTVGELLVKSRYLAVGYWGRPDLTQAAFLPDPGGTAARLYRTGDLARLRPDGCLEHFGRRDAMVKVRGNRVELMEIELALQSIAGVVQAAVVARERELAETCVVAYVAPALPPGPSTEQLRRALQERFPSYMVPAAFVRLPALPSTSQGKVDRRALPEPDWERTTANALALAPGTALESALAGLWASVLQVSDVNPQDDFLVLGGDSLQAARLISSVKAVFGVDLPLQSLFQDAATVAGMARAIEAVRRAGG